MTSKEFSGYINIVQLEVTLIVLSDLMAALEKLLADEPLQDRDISTLEAAADIVGCSLANYRHRRAQEETEERKRAIGGTSWLGLLLQAVEWLLKYKFHYPLKLGEEKTKSNHSISLLVETIDSHVTGFLKINGAIKAELDKKAVGIISDDGGVASLLSQKGQHNAFLGMVYYEIDPGKLQELYRNIVAGNMPELQPTEGANGPTLEPIMTEETREPPEQPYTVG